MKATTKYVIGLLIAAVFALALVGGKLSAGGLGPLMLSLQPAPVGATPMVDPIFDPNQSSEKHPATLDPMTLAIYAKAYIRPCAFGILHTRH
ncbi:MAG: hypothetical protein ACJ78Q_07045 [Chloroflexia bacterium]